MTPKQKHRQLFLEKIGRLKRSGQRRLALESAVGAVGLFLLGTAAWLVLMRLGYWPAGNQWPLALLGAVAAALAVLYFWMQGIAMVDLLIGLDRRNDLKDRLATAFEVANQRPARQSRYEGALMVDALACLQGLLSSKKGAPSHRWPYWVLAVGAAVIIVVLVVDWPSRDTRTAQGSVVLDRESEGTDGALPLGETLYRRKTRKGEGARDLDGRKGSPAEIDRSGGGGQGSPHAVDGDLKGIGSGERAKAHDAFERLESGDVADADAPDDTPAGDGDPRGASQPKEMVPVALPQEATRRLSEQAAGEDSVNGEEDGGELSREESTGFTGSQPPKADNQAGQSLDILGDPPAGEDADADRSGQAGGRDGDNSERAAQLPQGRRGDGRPSEGQGAGSEESRTFGVGSGKANGKKRDPYALETAKGPAVKDKGLSGGKATRKVKMRAPYAIGRAEMDEREVLRQYQQEAETALAREELPLYYRDMIQRYFDAIGFSDGEGQTE